MKRIILCLVAVGGLAGCSVRADVTGLVGYDGELYTGTATGYLDRTGTIDLHTETGARCVGQYGYTGAKTGRGTLLCNDGQRVDIQFNSITPLTGYGYGVSNTGKPVRFTYGLSKSEGAQYLEVPPAPTSAAATSTGSDPGAPPQPESTSVDNVRPPAPSARSVPMQKVGGTYAVPVLINNAIALDFVVDSGAADVSIPADVVLTLMRTGTIKKTDFLGTKTYTLADGSTVPSSTFRIKSLKVGDRVVENVTGSLADVRGSLLLGQSFLGRFKSWSIDNAKHVLMLE